MARKECRVFMGSECGSRKLVSIGKSERKMGRLFHARGPGHFAWHHKAPVFSWNGQESAPRLIPRIFADPFVQNVLPAYAAQAQRPGPRATTEVGPKRTK